MQNKIEVFVVWILSIFTNLHTILMELSLRNVIFV